MYYLLARLAMTRMKFWHRIEALAARRKDKAARRWFEIHTG